MSVKRKQLTENLNLKSKKQKISSDSKSQNNKKSEQKNEKKSLPVKDKTDNKKSKQKSELKKPEDWNIYKKEKKDLKIKRKQLKNNFDIVNQAKKIGECLRRKQLKNEIEKRNKLVNDLHNLLKNSDNYSKFVLAHDTARIVQWLLKYSSVFIRGEIFNQLHESIPSMMLSKYGVFCVKRLLKYSTTEIRLKIINKFYGNSVKFASHVVSASCFEYAYSTFATPQQKLHLIQEFYGEIYRNSKDDSIKCLNDVFKKSPDLKNAALNSIKVNLERIFNKNLFDSGLVQSVIYQFLIECSATDRSEMISKLIPHIVVISNSKDGSRIAMNCIWHGSNKDRKALMKKIKDSLIDMCKHEHGHCAIIALIDSCDDTVLLNKIILTEILKNAKSLSEDEWGKKVLLWLVAPNDTSYFHPLIIKELDEGRKSSTSKKPIETRRDEILSYSSSALLKLIIDEPEFWLSDSKRAYEMLAIIKSARTNKEIEDVNESLAKIIVNLNWKVKENKEEVVGVEHTALHLVLKKIAKHDKINLEKEQPTFGASLIKYLTKELVQLWIKSNRGCFFLVLILENNSEMVQDVIKEKLVSLKKNLEKLDSQGAKILLKKIS